MVSLCPTSEKSRKHKLVFYDVMSGVNLDQSEVKYTEKKVYSALSLQTLENIKHCILELYKYG